MTILKNEYYTLKITDTGSNGEGIGKLDGFTVFVENAAAGDLIKIKMLKVKKNYGYGKLIEIIEPSPIRQTPVCSAYPRCGGCNLQHIKYENQLEIKTKMVKDNLERIGGFKNIEVPLAKGMQEPYFYRNKAQLPVGKINNETAIGFFAKKSHNIINIDKCYIQHPINTKIIKLVREFIEENNIAVYNEENHTGIIRHILTRTGHKTDEIIIMIVINTKKLPLKEKLIEKLIQLDGIKGIVININREKTNVILGDSTEVIWGDGFITDYIGNLKFEISPLSFYQVNPVQTKLLYEEVLNFANLDNKNQIVIDAYCGIGTISLFLAQKAKKVYGVEIIEEAINDANKNAQLNNITNAEFIVGKSEEVIPKLYKENNIKADVIVVDPPRKGCDEELLKVICEMKPEKVVYVSCDSATLARDLKFLCENDFKLEKVQPFDLFCMTTHVETVCLLSKKKG